MFNSKKRIVIFAALLVLLVVTGYLNYQFNNTQTASATPASPTPTATQEEGILDESAAAVSANFFSDFRAERNTVRENELQELEGVITNQASDQDIINMAQQQKLDLIAAMEKEVNIEGLIKAKGFDEAVVTLHEGSVNVVVDSADLGGSQVAQILDIVMRETGESSENIKIMPKN